MIAESCPITVNGWVSASISIFIESANLIRLLFGFSVASLFVFLCNKLVPRIPKVVAPFVIITVLMTFTAGLTYAKFKDCPKTELPPPIKEYSTTQTCTTYQPCILIKQTILNGLKTLFKSWESQTDKGLNRYFANRGISGALTDADESLDYLREVCNCVLKIISFRPQFPEEFNIAGNTQSDSEITVDIGLNLEKRSVTNGSSNTTSRVFGRYTFRLTKTNDNFYITEVEPALNLR